MSVDQALLLLVTIIWINNGAAALADGNLPAGGFALTIAFGLALVLTSSFNRPGPPPPSLRGGQAG